MRTSATLLSAAALVGFAAASPAPQQIDFNAVLAAPAVTQSGPALSIFNQTVAINTASISSSIVAAVTSVATASITGAQASAAATSVPSSTAVANSKRWWNLFGGNQNLGNLFQGNQNQGQSSSLSTTAWPTSTTSTSATVKSTSSTSATSSASVSSSSSSSVLASTTTLQTSVNGTATTSSSTACATVPEAGTYCGFINPEDPCAPQPTGSGPTVTPDTVSAFMAYAPFQSIATNAPTPSGYVQTFKSLNASSSANSYLGLYTLTAYNTSACAALCDNTTDCTAFNLYIERDPSQNPSANDSTAATVWGYWCPNPVSITNFKCTLWGSDLDNTTATNTGGWREQFQVVIVGSNGYDKTNLTTPANVTSFDPPKNCSGNAINGGQYFVGSKFFSGPFDPHVCGTYAQAQTSTNKAAAVAAGKSSYTPCNMFNAYHLHSNGVPMGTYCSLYDTPLSTNWASYSGSWSGQTYYGVRNSWTYSLSSQDSGKC